MEERFATTVVHLLKDGRWPITIHVGNVFLRNPTASRAASNSAVSSDVELRLSGSLKLLWVSDKIFATCQKFLFQGLKKLSSARG